MYNIDEKESKRHQELLNEHSQIHKIMTDLRSVASLSPHVHLSNDIGVTKTNVVYPKCLCMKLAKEAVRIAEERLHEIESEVWPNHLSSCNGGDVCTDGRFETIRYFKERLVEATNIANSQDEMSVLNSILFRFWQMGWLKVIMDADDGRAATIRKEKLKRKYGDILAAQTGIYSNPVVMDVLGAVMDEISDLGWLDILERHQPKEEKANGWKATK